MIKTIEGWLDTVAAVALIAMGLLIVANVIGRQFLQSGVPDIIILVRELMVPAILFPLATATGQRAHVAIDFLAQHFPDGLNRWIAVLAGVIGLLVALTLLRAGIHEFSVNWASGAHYAGDFQLPKWPSRAVFSLALGVLSLRMLMVLAIDLKAAVTGQPAPLPESKGTH